MSYDLEVYLSKPLTADVLVGVVERRGLRLEPNGESWLAMTRGGACRFEVLLAVETDVEELPEQVAARLLEVRTVVEMMVPGFDETGIGEALRLARVLAAEFEGAVMDRQTGQVWSRAKQRRVARVSADVRFSGFAIHWFALPGGVPEDPVRVWVEAARRWLPEALPVKGTPGGPKWSWDGDATDQVRQYWRGEAEGIVPNGLWFRARSMPCTDGTLDVPVQRMDAAARRNPHLIWHAWLIGSVEPLVDQRWQTAFRKFFTAIAEGMGAFYAEMQVLRGRERSGNHTFRVAGGDGDDTGIRGMGEWFGLPPDPVWWEWFAGEYRAVVEPVVAGSGARTEVHGEGLFVQWSDAPCDRRELAALQGPEVMEPFRAVYAEQPHVRWGAVSEPKPLVPARIIPESVRTATTRSGTES